MHKDNNKITIQSELRTNTVYLNQPLKNRAANYIDELEAKKMNWQTIETAPDSLSVDLWVKNKNNPNYGRRVVHAAKVNGVWYGRDLPNPKYGEFASHWMPLPDAPEVKP